MARLLTRPALAATSPARPESAKTASSPRDAPCPQASPQLTLISRFTGTMLADFFNSLLVSAGGRVAWSVALSGWGYRRNRRGFGGGLRSLFLFEIDDRGRKCPFFC